MYIGDVQHLLTTSEVVFIPFVCHRCGKCCRELSVPGFDKPCPFLSEDNLCLIYPARPDPCRLYPIETDFGDCGIGCPGLLEVRRAEKKLGRGIPYYTMPYISHLPPKVRVRPERWNKTLEKYLKSKPSKKALELFIEVNKPK